MHEPFNRADPPSFPWIPPRTFTDDTDDTDYTAHAPARPLSTVNNLKPRKHSADPNATVQLSTSNSFGGMGARVSRVRRAVATAPPRYTQYALMCIVGLVGYADRINMSVAVIGMAEELGE